jgi:hypothetical protein
MWALIIALPYRCDARLRYDRTKDSVPLRCNMHHTRCKMWQAGRCSQGGADCDGRHHSHNQRVRSPLQARQRTLKCRWAQRTTAQRHRRCGSPLPFEGAHTLAPCAATPFHTHQTQIVRCSPSLPPTCSDARMHARTAHSPLFE